MATKHAVHHSEPVLESAMDYAEHEKTYNGFIAAVKWSVISLAALLVILFFVVQP
ncbi:aa3-type cytochrome c oxidase subunit IV [Devosia sp.]|uniref:aa3-type cytochrome c oxidase subunit IV n=1 Tax=Devosia sp. TaxID=1871048 RepID=UPI001B2ED3D5|nr:aa3-type cytochrome c oxidase subunit IV [Devosia sp.]MBO9589973.1 aa3-type cytochrome c oxidase subunit IV [Devosia sp.]